MANNNKFIKILPELQGLDFNKCDLALSLFLGKTPTHQELEKLKETIQAKQHSDLITKRIKHDEKSFTQIKELANFYKISLQSMVNIMFLWSKDNELLRKDI